MRTTSSLAALLLAAAVLSASSSPFASAAPAPAPASAPPTSDDEAIRKALEADQHPPSNPPSPSPSPTGTPSSPTTEAPASGSGPTGLSLLNPNMSVILDGSFGYYGRHTGDFARVGIPVAGDDPSSAHEGFTLQEVEVAFQAAIDPYFEGNVFLTIPNLEGIEVEEAYLQTTSLPANLQVKAGSFRSQVGRNNGQHLHLQNFTRRPLMTSLLFGADGLRGPGVQASWLVPRLPWFATLYAEALSLPPPDEGVATFGSGGRGLGHLTYTAALEQFWPLSDTQSIMLGLNVATGRASECAAPPCGTGRRSYLYGADLYYKWRPADGGLVTSLGWSTEYFSRAIAGGDTVGALYTEPVIQLDKRWYLAARLDVTGIPSGDAVPRRFGVAGSATFAPTEFSRLRLYLQNLAGPGLASVLVGFLQIEFSMGAHGAHPF